jgi:hypothetical protein
LEELSFNGAGAGGSESVSPLAAARVAVAEVDVRDDGKPSLVVDGDARVEVRLSQPPPRRIARLGPRLQEQLGQLAASVLDAVRADRPRVLARRGERDVDLAGLRASGSRELEVRRSELGELGAELRGNRTAARGELAS